MITGANVSAHERVLKYILEDGGEACLIIPAFAELLPEEQRIARIEGWFIDHARPLPGETISIDAWQFEPQLFQPEHLRLESSAARKR